MKWKVGPCRESASSVVIPPLSPEAFLQKVPILEEGNCFWPCAVVNGMALQKAGDTHKIHTHTFFLPGPRRKSIYISLYLSLLLVKLRALEWDLRNPHCNSGANH